MRHAGRLFACSVLASLWGSAAPVAAQAPVPVAPLAAPAPAGLPPIDFATAAEARTLIARAKASLQPGQATAPPLPLVRVPGYRAVVEYRVSPTPATSHDRDAEFMYVLEGSGTLVMGGTLVDPHRPNAANIIGSGISGGTSHALAPGSFIFVPKGVPHHFAQIGSDGLSVVTMHIPVAPVP